MSRAAVIMKQRENEPITSCQHSFFLLLLLTAKNCRETGASSFYSTCYISQSYKFRFCFVKKKDRNHFNWNKNSTKMTSLDTLSALFEEFGFELDGNMIEKCKWCIRLMTICLTKD